YAAYGLAWDDVNGAGFASGLRDEAHFLASLLAAQMPDEPEVLGLLSLLLFAHARRDARRDDGSYVPLREQDTARAGTTPRSHARRRSWRGRPPWAGSARFSWRRRCSRPTSTVYSVARLITPP